MFLVLTGLLAAALAMASAWLLHRYLRLLASHEALGRRRDLLEAVVDAAPYPIVARDTSGRFIVANAALETFLGIARDRLLGKTMDASGLSDNIVAAVTPVLERARDTGARAEETLRVQDALGHWRDLLFSVESIRLRDGTAGGSISATIDITGQLAAEQAARDAKRMLDEITDALPVASFQLCAEPDGRYSFSYFSGKAERYRGWSAERLLAVVDGAYPSVHPEDRLKMAAALRQSAEGQSASRFELRIVVDGETRWLRMFVGAPRRSDGGQLRWSGYAGDATEDHLRLEALAAARAAAEDAAQAKARFLAAITHEIRTPLATVIGALELLGGTPMAPEQKGELELADNAARLLLDILGGTLDYSRLEAGRLVLESIAVDLRELVDEVMQLHAPAIAAKGLRLSAQVDSGVAAQLLGDPTRFKEILLNLIGNAVKFTASGSITVGLRLLEDHGAEQQIELSVADTGIGIAPERQQQLFAPFTQADTSISRRFGGSGLGLAICHRLAELMGGTLTLESEPGVGTTIALRVALPVARRLPRPQAPEATEPDLARKAILVVEDHLPFQVILRRQLESLGQDCTIVSDGEAALDALHRHRFALVFTDCQMPGMSGFELAGHIRQSGGSVNAEVPIVALSAAVGADLAAQCRQAGMDACLAKPVRMQELKQCIRQWAR